MVDQKRNWKKIAWWIGGILGGLILLLGIAAIYISAKWKPLLTTKIKEGVFEGSKHLYRVDFNDIHLNLLSGNIVLDSVKLTPDTVVYNKLITIKKAPTHLFRIKLAHLKLSRVGVLTAYLNKKIKMNSIVLDNPSIDMIYRKVPKRADTAKEDLTLYQQISKSIRSIRINSIRIVDADFDYYSGAKKLNAVKHLTVNVKDVLIDSLSQYDSTRVFHAKDIGFEMIGYQSLTKDKMYNIKVDTVQGSISRKTMRIQGLLLTPMYPDLTFSRKYKVQKDRYNLSFNTIDARGVDFVELNKMGVLNAKHITIGPAKVAVFMNRELPPPSFDKGRNYPHNALKRLPFPAKIDTIKLSAVDIAYTEYNPKASERGTLHLENLGGAIFNVTNDSLQLTKKSHANANLTTYIMGKGKLNVKIDFNLTDRNGAFAYVGTADGFNMQVLNPLSKSLGLVEIKSGFVKSLDFNISANERGSSGTVVFRYNDLKVNLLGEDEEGKKQKKGLLSFLANTILIKNDNPSKNDPVRVSKITMVRVPQASFFNLMWKSIFIGVRETVGIGIVPMKKMEEPSKSRKQMREERKAEKKKEKAKTAKPKKQI